MNDFSITGFTGPTQAATASIDMSNMVTNYGQYFNIYPRSGLPSGFSISGNTLSVNISNQNANGNFDMVAKGSAGCITYRNFTYDIKQVTYPSSTTSIKNLDNTSGTSFDLTTNLSSFPSDQKSFVVFEVSKLVVDGFVSDSGLYSISGQNLVLATNSSQYLTTGTYIYAIITAEILGTKNANFMKFLYKHL